MALKVSPEWKEAIGAQFRYPAHAQATVTVAPPGMREGATITVTEGSTWSGSRIETIIDGIASERVPIASFEPNRWVGDGSMGLATSQSGDIDASIWWSNEVPVTTGHDSYGSIIFRIDLNPEDTTTVYSVPGMYISWDTETNSWPEQVWISGTKVDGTSAGYGFFNNNTAVQQYYECPLVDVKHIYIAIGRWQPRVWRARIDEIMFGLYQRFTNDDIISIEYNASTSLTSSELPLQTLTMKINNYDRIFDPMLKEGFSKYLATRQAVQIQWGFETLYGTVEWMSPWHMYLNAWSIPSDEYTASITATNRLSFLTDTYTRGIYDKSEHTFSALAVAVLNNSNIMRENVSEAPWEIPATLGEYTTNAPIPLCATNAALQYIANATGHFMDIKSADGHIRFRDVTKTASTTYSVGKAQQIGDPAITISNTLKSISIGVQSYTTAAEASEVYTATLSVGAGDTLIVATFSSIVVNPQLTISNSATASVVYYAYSAEITIHAKTAATVDISIVGQTVERVTTYVTTYEDTLVSNGLRIQVDNPLITNMTTAKHLSDVLQNLYQRRHTLDVQYLGFPELETGDRIGIPNVYNGVANADITGLSLTFDGSYTGTLNLLSTEVTE